MQRTCSYIGSTSAGRESMRTSAVALASVAVNAVDLQLHWQYVRRSRVHENQRSCACGLSAHSRSKAGNNGGEQPVGGSECSVLALASVPVNAVERQLHCQHVRRSQVHGHQQRTCTCCLRRRAAACVSRSNNGSNQLHSHCGGAGATSVAERPPV